MVCLFVWLVGWLVGWLVCVGVCWCVLVCVGVCWWVLVCVGVCWCVLVCVGVCWCVLVCVGVCWCGCGCGCCCCWVYCGCNMTELQLGAGAACRRVQTCSERASTRLARPYWWNGRWLSFRAINGFLTTKKCRNIRNSWKTWESIGRSWTLKWGLTNSNQELLV